MIVSDLDGTIVNSRLEGYTLCDNLINEISEFQKQGKIFTIATGRPKETTINVIKKLGIDSPFIVENGAKIVNKDGLNLYSDVFALNDFSILLSTLDDIGATIIFTLNEELICYKYTNKVEEYEQKEFIKCKLLDKSALDSIINVSKILIIGDIKNYITHWNNIDENLKLRFKYVISEDDYMEIISKNVSKGEALKKLKKLLNLKDDEVVTIGNHLNDKELITEAHIGFAVANAVADIKKLADFTTIHEYEKGVVEVIKKFI
jgi:hypothetical protein